MAKNKDQVTKRRLQTSYITTIVSITLVLFLLGVMGLLILNSEKLSVYVKENIGFSVILKENSKEADIIKLRKQLDATKYIKSTRFITKDEAAEDLKKELGEDFTEFIGYNPLLSSIDVKLYADYTNADSLAVIENDLARYDNLIKEVFYQKNLISIVNQNVKRISFVLLIFSALLFFISWALINNTIRLSVYSKRFLIKTMQLVGATKGFIRTPFLNSGTIAGIIGGIIANLMLVVIIRYTEKEFEGAISFADLNILIILFSGIIVLGVIISRISAFYAVNKYLKIKGKELYYK